MFEIVHLLQLHIYLRNRIAGDVLITDDVRRLWDAAAATSIAGKFIIAVYEA